VLGPNGLVVDMWQAFMSSVAKHVPNSKIVHDRFRITKYRGEAFDEASRAEHRELKQQGDGRGKGVSPGSDPIVFGIAVALLIETAG
jgi:transposase